MKHKSRQWWIAPPNYGQKDLRGDIIAGLTVGVLLIPQAMAYALLAGVPPVYGIYASLVPLVIYALFTSSPHVSVGPTALASILALSALNEIATPGTADYLQLILLLALLTGLIQLLFGLLRLGDLVSFLSRPVVSGFVSAAAVLIAFSQIKTLLGVEVPQTRFLHHTLLALIGNIGTLHLLTAIIGGISIGLLLALKKWVPRWPATLTIIIVATLLSWIWQLDRYGLPIVGNLPSGLPGFSIPDVNLTTALNLLPAALIIGLISFVETLSIGKTYAERHDYYQLNPNRELIALGAAKLAGAFFQAIPTSASFSRSAVSEASGTRSPLSSIVAAVLVAIAALFIMSAFYYLPLSVLAAIIILSVRSLFDWQEIRRLWHLDKKDWAALMVTFLVTLFGGLQFGIAAGVLLSLIFFILKSARPHLAELGRLPGTNAFRNVDRFAEVMTEPDVLILRFDAELYFGNADFFQSQLEKLIRQKGIMLKLIIIDAHTIHDLDTTGAYILQRLITRLRERGISFYLCGAIGPVRDRLYHIGLMENLGPGHQFLSIQDALDYYHAKSKTDRDWNRPAVQHD